MRILGIDPGLGITGYGIIEDRNFRLVEAGVIRTKPNTPIQARIENETKKPKKRIGIKELKKNTKNPTTTENPLYTIPLPIEVMVLT